MELRFARALGPLVFVISGAGLYACAVGADASDDGVGTGAHDAATEAAQDYDGYPVGDDDSGTESEASAPIDAGADSAQSSDCLAPNSCNAARATVPSSISGDSSPANNAVTTQGSSEDWVKVRVTEDSHGPTAHAMTVKAVLTSPAGANYDLEMYVDDSKDTVSCSGPVETSSVPGNQTDQVVHQWGETGTFANASDDSRTVNFHIKYASGPCGPGNEWTLVITGNP